MLYCQMILNVSSLTPGSLNYFFFLFFSSGKQLALHKDQKCLAWMQLLWSTKAKVKYLEVSQEITIQQFFRLTKRSGQLVPSDTSTSMIENSTVGPLANQKTTISTVQGRSLLILFGSHQDLEQIDEDYLKSSLTKIHFPVKDN